MSITACFTPVFRRNTWGAGRKITPIPLGSSPRALTPSGEISERFSCPRARPPEGAFLRNKSALRLPSDLGSSVSEGNTEAGELGAKREEEPGNTIDLKFP